MNIPEGSSLITEGATKLYVPFEHSENGPGKRVGRVFFNEQMSFNRDVSVMFFKAVGPVKSALDGMASTGSRAIRICNEAGGDVHFLANDKDVEACRYIEANIEANQLSNCEHSNEDIRCLLARKVFSYIDIDPFGTPVHFLPSAVQGLKRRGMIGVTATDTAPLAGTYPKKCLRRYGAHSARSPFGHETGLRILIGHLVHEAAKEDRGIHCLLSFYADHYFRVYVSFIEGGEASDNCLDQMGYIDYNPDTGERDLGHQPTSPRSIGPLWLGPLHDKELLYKMSADDNLANRTRCEKYLSLWREEIDVPYFFENDELASMLNTSPPKMEKVLEKVGQVGKISKTHFSPTGFKTDLELKELLSVYSDVA